MIIYKKGQDGSFEEMFRFGPVGGPSSEILLKDKHFTALKRVSGTLVDDDHDTHNDNDKACGIRALAVTLGLLGDHSLLENAKRNLLKVLQIWQVNYSTNVI